MTLIESGQVVKIEFVLKVPPGMPPGFDARGWALACMSINGEALQHMAVSPVAILGSVKPSPTLVP